MGYTHYWTHSKAFTKQEWQKIELDVCQILRHAQLKGLALGDSFGEQEIDPESACLGETISFNGIGADSHETFTIYKGRRPQESWQDSNQHGWDFCKTAQKPYDIAVTAILAYLESAYPSKFSASSDGTYSEWGEGAALAKESLKAFAGDIRPPVSVLLEEIENR